MKKTILSTIIALFLLLATQCLATDVNLSPASFKPENDLLGNKNYNFSFYVSTNSDIPIDVDIKIECRGKNEDNWESRECGDPSWYRYKPKSFSVGGDNGRSQEIKVKLKIPKDAKNIGYASLFVAYPKVEASSTGNTKIQPALGGNIYYSKNSSIGFTKRSLYWLQASILSPASNMVEWIESKFSYSLLLISLLFFGIFFIIKKRFQKRKRKLKDNDSFFNEKTGGIEKQ